MSDDAKRPGEPADKNLPVNTAQIERPAKVEPSRNTSRHWHSKFDDTLGEPSEVRSLTTDATAKAQAEESLKRMMEKQKGSSRGRRY